MDKRVIWASGHGVALLVGLAGIAFTSGYWSVLIAFAPAAYLLVLFPYDSDSGPKIVLVSHLTALVVGWIAYTALAQGVSPTSIEPMSASGLRLVVSTSLAFVGCTTIFYLLNIQHSMAYVTSFIASIGGFPTVYSLSAALVAILFVAGLQALRRKLGPETDAASNLPVGSLSEPSSRR